MRERECGYLWFKAKALGPNQDQHKSEVVVVEDVLSGDHSAQGPVGGVNDEQVAAVVNPELLQNLEELVVHAHRHRALNHVRPQVNPLFVALFNHVFKDFGGIGLG